MPAHGVGRLIIKGIKSTLLALTIGLLITPPVTLALGPEQRSLFNRNIFYYSADAGCTAGGSNLAPPATASLANATQVGAFSGPQITPTAIVLHWTAGAYGTNPNALVSVLRSRTEPDGAGNQYPNGRSVQLTINKQGTVYQLSQSLETRPMQTFNDQSWNDATIGIEIESGSFATIAEHETDLLNNAAQYQAVLSVVSELMSRYNIANEQNTAAKKGIFGHYDIQPGNSDPGPNYMAKVRTELGAVTIAPPPPATSGGCTCTDPSINGSNNVQTAYNFFSAKGLNPIQAAGLVGTLQGESATLDPKQQQYGGGPGRGIAQWTVTERWKVLLDFAAAQGKDPLTLLTQLEFVWFELTGEPPVNGVPGASRRGAYDALKVAPTIEEAVRIGTVLYEGAGVLRLAERVKFAQDALAAYGSSAPSGGSSTSVCLGGVGGIDTFPLRTTKAQILAGSQGARWCYAKTTNCHHDYNAADIHVPPLTEVIATKSGKVVSATDAVGGVGSRVTIKGSDNQYLYYYTHMAYGSLAVAEGDQVTAGQVIGAVGESAQAVGTAPHLHYDMLPGDRYNQRPGCSSGGCTSYPFIDVQPLLKQLYDTVVPN